MRLRDFVIALSIGATVGVTDITHAQTGGAKPLPPGLPPGMPMPTNRPPQTLDDRMTGRNERALQSLGYFQCLSTAIVASRTGRVGPAPRGEMIVCLEHRGEWRAVFGALRTGEGEGFSVRTQLVMRGEGAVVSDPVDTNKLIATAKAMIRAASAPMPGTSRHEFLPVVIQQAKFFEIWFLPVQSSAGAAVVGGDSLIQMSSDGVRELGHSTKTPPIRTLQVFKGPSFIMASTEDEIPTVSELAVANLALGIVTEVRILTKKWEWLQTKSSGSWRPLGRAP